MSETSHIVETAIAEIADQGYAIVRDLISGERLEQLQRDAEQLLHEIPAKGIDGKQIAGRMHKGTFAVSRAFDDVIIHPTLLAIVRGVLDDSKADNYPHVAQMNEYISQLDPAEQGIKCNIMIKDAVPREDIRALHQDIRMPVPRPHRPLVVNSLLALDRYTEHRGATCVVPGSHKWDKPVEPDTPTIPVEMEAGSIVIFDGMLWHGHGPNYTHDQNRRCLNLNYHYRWIQNFPTQRPPENQWNDLPAALRAMQ